MQSVKIEQLSLENQDHLSFWVGGLFFYTQKKEEDYGFA